MPTQIPKGRAPFAVDNDPLEPGDARRVYVQDEEL
jgi:hypothetical protein